MKKIVKCEQRKVQTFNKVVYSTPKLLFFLKKPEHIKHCQQFLYSLCEIGFNIQLRNRLLMLKSHQSDFANLLDRPIFHNFHNFHQRKYKMDVNIN